MTQLLSRKKVCSPLARRSVRGLPPPIPEGIEPVLTAPPYSGIFYMTDCAPFTSAEAGASRAVMAQRGGRVACVEVLSEVLRRIVKGQERWRRMPRWYVRYCAP
jgi:hypothetical protein